MKSYSAGVGRRNARRRTTSSSKGGGGGGLCLDPGSETREGQNGYLGGNTGTIKKAFRAPVKKEGDWSWSEKTRGNR